MDATAIAKWDRRAIASRSRARLRALKGGATGKSKALAKGKGAALPDPTLPLEYVRLPKPLIEQAGFTDEVELEVRGNTIVIAAHLAPRAGWAEAARKLRAQGGDRLLDPPTATHFDQTEWEW